MKKCLNRFLIAAGWLLIFLGIYGALRNETARGAVGVAPPPGLASQVSYVNAGANLYQAKLGASAGTTIVVGPGLYTTGVTNLAKENVNWHFMPGAVVSNANNNFVFDNSGRGEPTALNWSVTGYGEFIDTGPSAGVFFGGIFLISNSLSTVKLQFKSAVSRRAVPQFGTVSIIKAQTVFVDADVIDATGGPYTFWWREGEVYGDVRQMFNDGFNSVLQCDGGVEANLYLNCQLIICTNEIAVLLEPTHANNKTWLRCNEIIGAPDLFANGSISIRQGKLYLNYDKLSTIGLGVAGNSVLYQEGGQLWATGQKITTTNGNSFFIQTNGFSRIQNLQYEDAGAGAGGRPYNFLVSGGTNEVWGGNALTTSGPGYKVTSGGTCYLRDLTLNTFSTLRQSNTCLWIVGGTSIVQNCTFIPGSLFSVSNASAGDLRVYGTGGLRAKSNITATLTVRVGTVTVDGTYVDR